MIPILLYIRSSISNSQIKAKSQPDSVGGHFQIKKSKTKRKWDCPLSWLKKNKSNALVLNKLK